MLKCFRAMARTPSPLTISPGPTAAAAYLNRRHCSCSAPDCWVSVAADGNSRRYSDPILEERAGPPTVRLEWAAILHLIRKRGPTLHQSWTRKPGKGGPPASHCSECQRLTVADEAPSGRVRGSDCRDARALCPRTPGMRARTGSCQ